MFAFNLKFKDILTLSALIVVLGFLSIGAYQEYNKKIEISRLSDELKLKAPEENIIQYTEYDSSGRPLESPSGENSTSTDNNLVKYIYRTNIVVPEATYNGLKEDITQRTPNTQIFLKSEKVIAPNKIEKTFVGKFYSGVRFNKSGDKWFEVRTATTTKSALLKQTRLTLLAKAKNLLGRKVLADDFYIVNTGDGYVSAVVGAVWVDQRNRAGCDLANYSGATLLAQAAQSGANYEIERGFLPFNTSGITGGSVINSVTLNVYVVTTSDGDNDGADYINVVETSQPSASLLSVNDYNNAIETEGTGVPTEGATAIDLTAGFTNSQYNAFILNIAGLSWIKREGETSNCGGGTGVTCLGLREGHDIAANNVIANSTGNGISINSFDSVNAPYLTVTFTVPPPSIKINGGTMKINGGTVKVNSN